MSWPGFALLGFLVATELGVQQPTAPPLRVGMDTRSPPWSFVPGQDYSKEDLGKDPLINPGQLRRVQGLDVDVAAALAQRLGMTLQIVPVAWDDLRNALLARRIDAIVNAYTPSRADPPEVVATEPYYHWGLLIAVRADDRSVRGFTDLAGRTIGHFRTKLLDRSLRALNPRELKVYDVQEALFDDLKAGRLDAAIYDSPYVRWRAANDPAFRTVGQPLNKLGYHVALRREDASLFARMQAAVQALVSSGDAERIREKWESLRRP